jgi:hypothetical protein
MISGIAEEKEWNEKRSAERGEQEFAMRCDEESRAGGKIRSADVIRDCKIRTINDELASRTVEHRSRREIRAHG